MGLHLKWLIVEQFDRYWSDTLRPRLAEVTDAEYSWEPFPTCLSLRRQSDGSWAPDAGEPAPPNLAPLTTIAWRLHHLANVLCQAAQSQFGAADLPPDTEGTVANALRRIDGVYADWNRGIAALDDTHLRRPTVATEAGSHPSLAEFAVQLNNELIGQIAQVSLMRDLYRAKQLDRLRTRRPTTSRRRR